MLGALLAYILSLACPTPTAWIEHDADVVWFAVCGDDDGTTVEDPFLLRDLR